MRSSSIDQERCSKLFPRFAPILPIVWFVSKRTGVPEKDPFVHIFPFKKTVNPVVVTCRVI